MCAYAACAAPAARPARYRQRKNEPYGHPPGGRPEGPRRRPPAARCVAQALETDSRSDRRPAARTAGWAVARHRPARVPAAAGRLRELRRPCRARPPGPGRTQAARAAGPAQRPPLRPGPAAPGPAGARAARPRMRTPIQDPPAASAIAVRRRRTPGAAARGRRHRPTESCPAAPPRPRDAHPGARRPPAPAGWHAASRRAVRPAPPGAHRVPSAPCVPVPAAPRPGRSRLRNAPDRPDPHPTDRPPRRSGAYAALRASASAPPRRPGIGPAAPAAGGSRQDCAARARVHRRARAIVPRVPAARRARRPAPV